MAWNLRAKVVAMGVALQVTPGVFLAPTSADLVAVSVPNDQTNPITADDPTATGGIWDAPPVVLGETSTAGGTIPLRGPGGSAPPAANAWPVGRILQAAGWTELRNGTAITGEVLQAGSTTTSLVLANTQSSTDDALIGVPVTQASAGTGFRATTLIRDYVGSSRTAQLAETLGGAPATGASYTIPAYLLYQLGTLTTAPPKLSISIWRDKKRYDYKDWQPTSLVIDVPVANDANTVFPSIEFSGQGVFVAEADEAAPTLTTQLQVPVAPARGGKFFLDQVLLGHQSVRFTEGTEVGAPSNQNQDAGQDGYEIMSGNRSIDLDLNNMTVATYNIRNTTSTRKVVPILSTWGLGAGNRWGLLLPNNILNPMSSGERNGFVNLTGNAAPQDVDKSAALAIWW